MTAETAAFKPAVAGIAMATIITVMAAATSPATTSTMMGSISSTTIMMEKS